MQNTRELVHADDSIGRDGIIERGLFVDSRSDDQNKRKDNDHMQDEICLEDRGKRRVVSGDASHVADGGVILDRSSEATSAGNPARTTKKNTKAIDDGIIGEIALHDVKVVAKLRAENVEEVVGVNQTVSGGFLLLLESSKHAIPDDENTSIVFVEIFGVSSMVNTVVGRRVENKFHEAIQLTDALSVHPELIERVKLFVNEKDTRRDEESQRKIEKPVEKLLENALTCGRRQILEKYRFRAQFMG